MTPGPLWWLIPPVKSYSPALLLVALLVSFTTSSPAADEPVPTQQGNSMQVPMQDHPRIRVGHADADIVGTDNRALQAAVDYIAALGGGIVEIGPGEFTMRDSLHLRNGVTVRGTPGKTILRKAASAISSLLADGDFGEEQITLANPTGFAVGDGVAIWDKNAGGFHTTVARITGRTGNTFGLSLPLNADCLAESDGKAATVFPVVNGSQAERVVLEHLVVEGSRTNNEHLNGCRGGGIFLIRCSGAVIRECAVRNYNGDGISFQQSNDVLVEKCVSEGNASLGIHPGSGSQRPTVRGCIARDNGEDGLFLCWRVKLGTFEDNVLEDNGRYGISIGHKDTDNLLRRNQVRNNREAGVCFRNESREMAAHRNRLEENLIENNGAASGSAGIRVRGHTDSLQLRANIIRDTRPAPERKQTIGIQLESNVGQIQMDRNQIDAAQPVLDQRKQ